MTNLYLGALNWRCSSPFACASLICKTCYKLFDWNINQFYLIVDFTFFFLCLSSGNCKWLLRAGSGLPFCSRWPPEPAHTIPISSENQLRTLAELWGRRSLYLHKLKSEYFNRAKVGFHWNVEWNLIFIWKSELLVSRSHSKACAKRIEKLFCLLYALFISVNVSLWLASRYLGSITPLYVNFFLPRTRKKCIRYFHHTPLHRPDEITVLVNARKRTPRRRTNGRVHLMFTQIWHSCLP